MMHLTEHDRLRIWRAELADMPPHVIEAWVAERGGVIVDRAWYRRALLAELADDDVPEDTRS